MFIAHAPASFIIRNFLPKMWKTKNHFWAGFAGSVFPDTDLLWFYLVDNRSTHHHDYLTHIPVYWIAFLFLWILLIPKHKSYWSVGLIFFINVLVHLLLDTVVGEIAWLYPVIKQKFSLVAVPSIYDWWVFNFVFHWTFLIEVLVAAAGIYFLIATRKFQKSGDSFC